MADETELIDYKQTELAKDIGQMQVKLDRIDKTLAKFGERIGKAESRIDTLYWLIGLAVPITSALTGVIVAFVN